MYLHLIIVPPNHTPPQFVWSATDGKTYLFWGEGERQNESSTWERSGRSLLSCAASGRNLLD